MERYCLLDGVPLRERPREEREERLELRCGEPRPRLLRGAFRRRSLGMMRRGLGSGSGSS